MGKFQMTEEYAFGPWILKISEKYPIPKLFQPYFQNSPSPLIFVKIPRDIDRQQIKGVVDLYDYVIAMYQDFIHIAKREEEKEVSELKILYSDIECVENYIDLLDGRLKIYLHNSLFEIKYNAVSEDIIQEMIQLIRSKYTQSTYQLFEKSYCLNESMDNIYFTLLKQLKSDGSNEKIFAMQPVIRTKEIENSKIKKLYRTFFYKKLLSSVFLSNEQELIILSRGKTFKQFREVIYSYSFKFIPLENIINIEQEILSEYQNIVRIGVRTQNYLFHNLLDSKNTYTKNFFDIHKRPVI
ncbi:hypothetical protein [Anaerosacchariphilus polymeriproducens]|uniref:Uncharacterized protein n=1 Tax=Anaerosacchariphilus polymeriproducens TaxID=1812858 RepID=A0A371ASK3_9FIRM|nr:hypothetical protein [Anaerosacchariphilus polymeriproducens]RDU22529.1 hypothetical protein DWV06_14700 [Anaerosacchariphilus polymeriproducens]